MPAGRARSTRGLWAHTVCPPCLHPSTRLCDGSPWPGRMLPGLPTDPRDLTHHRVKKTTSFFPIEQPLSGAVSLPQGHPPSPGPPRRDGQHVGQERGELLLEPSRGVPTQASHETTLPPPPPSKAAVSSLKAAASCHTKANSAQEADHTAQVHTHGWAAARGTGCPSAPHRCQPTGHRGPASSVSPPSRLHPSFAASTAAPPPHLHPCTHPPRPSRQPSPRRPACAAPPAHTHTLETKPTLVSRAPPFSSRSSPSRRTMSAPSPGWKAAQCPPAAPWDAGRGRRKS